MHSHGREAADLPAPLRFCRLGEFVIRSLTDFTFKDVAKDDGLEIARALIKILKNHHAALKQLLSESFDNNLSLSLQPRSRKKFNWVDEQFKEQDQAQCQAVSLQALLHVIQFYHCYLKIKEVIEENNKVTIDDAAREEFKRSQKFFLNRMKSIKCDVLPGYTALKLYEDYSQAPPIIRNQFLDGNVQRLQEILGIASGTSLPGKPSAAGHFSHHRYSQRKSVHESVIRKRDSTIFSI